MSDIAIEENTIPAINEETGAATRLQRGLLIGGMFVGLCALGGGFWFLKGEVADWWKEFNKPSTKSAQKASSGVDGGPGTIDLQAAIRDAAATQAMQQGAAATPGGAAAQATQPSPQLGGGQGGAMQLPQQPSGAAPAQAVAQQGAGQPLRPGQPGCKPDVTFDANGNPVAICAQDASAIRASQLAGKAINQPGQGARQQTQMVAAEVPPKPFNRLDVPLATMTAAPARSGAPGAMAASPAALSAAMANMAGLPTGAGASAGGLQPMEYLDPNKAIADYMKQIGAAGAAVGGSSGGAPSMGTPSIAGAGGLTGGPQAAQSGPLAGQFVGSKLTGVRATKIGDLNLLWPKGAGADCVLDGAIDASSSGYVSCTLSEHMYSANGRVVLAEKGSTMFLEYRGVTTQGQTNFPLIATSIRTAHGVTADLDSGAQGPLGQTGASGAIDNRWGERLGAAMIVALIGDAATLEIAKNTPAGGTPQYQASQGVAQSIPGKVLDSTINIRPRIVKNQGETIRVVAARDVDFSTVYSLVHR